MLVARQSRNNWHPGGFLLVSVVVAITLIMACMGWMLVVHKASAELALRKSQKRITYLIEYIERASADLSDTCNFQTSNPNADCRDKLKQVEILLQVFNTVMLQEQAAISTHGNLPVPVKNKFADWCAVVARQVYETVQKPRLRPFIKDHKVQKQLAQRRTVRGAVLLLI
jgi:hypothetical protein